MKQNRKVFRRILTLALALVMLATLTLPSFASQSVVNITSTGMTYEVWEGSRMILSTPTDRIREDWDRSGCDLHGRFDADCTMKRLRLVFNDAYYLWPYYYYMRSGNTADAVLNTSYRNYAPLNTLISSYQIGQYRGNDGIATLKNIKASYYYSSNGTVRAIVDGLLERLENDYPSHLRKSLTYFYPAEMANRLTVDQAVYLAYLVVSTPEYKGFYNALQGHDCLTVKYLEQQGYTVSYIAEAYTQQAVTAVQRIWPDYQSRMETYWQQTWAW